MAHEALLREWPRLRGWLEEDKQGRQLRDHLTQAARQWRLAGEEPSDLYRGARLSAVLDWAREHSPDLNDLEREFLSAARRAGEQESERQRRTSRRLRGLLTGTAVLLALALMGGGVALVQRSHAQAASTAAKAASTAAKAAAIAASAQALTIESQSDLTVDPEASVLLALRAVEDRSTPQTTLALREALDASPLRASLPSVATASCPTGGPSVAFRPGTDQVAELTCWKGLIVANAETGKVIRRMPGGAASVGVDLSYSPNGKYLALATYQGLVQVYDAHSGALLPELPVLPNLVTTYGASLKSVSYSPNSKMLGVTQVDNPSAIWDVKGGPPTMLQRSDNDSSLAFTSDDRFAITGTSQGVVTVFNPRNGKRVRTLHTGPQGLLDLPNYVVASPVGSLLAVAVNSDIGNSSVEIWSTRTWKEEFVLTTSASYQFSALSFSSDGTRLAAGESDGSAAVWSIGTRQEVVAMPDRTGAIDKIAFSVDGTEVATVSEDGIVRIWRASGPELDDVYLRGSIESVVLSGGRVVVASLDGGRVEISDWRTSGQELGHFVIPGSSSKDIVSLSPKGGYVADVVAASCPSGLPCPSVPIRVFDVETGRIFRSYPVPGAEAVTWSHDGREIALASTTLEVVSLATGSAVPLPPEGEQCGSDGPPVFSANDSLVAWATRCGTVGVFSVKGPQVRSLTVQGQPSGVAFNPAGTELAVSTWSGAVTVWNLRTARAALSLPLASSGVSHVTYSPDGRYIVTTLLNETAQVWGAKSGQLLRVDQTSAPLTVAPVFATRGSVFATGDAAGTVKLWEECPACGDPALLVHLGRNQVAVQNSRHWNDLQRVERRSR